MFSQKKHQKIGYVQGMHEILAVVLFCFVNEEKDDRLQEMAEIDGFFAFSQIMARISCNFAKDDRENAAVAKRLQSFSVLLRKIDAKLDEHLRAESWELRGNHRGSARSRGAGGREIGGEGQECGEGVGKLRDLLCFYFYKFICFIFKKRDGVKEFQKKKQKCEERYDDFMMCQASYGFNDLKCRRNFFCEFSNNIA